MKIFDNNNLSAAAGLNGLPLRILGLGCQPVHSGNRSAGNQRSIHRGGLGLGDRPAGNQRETYLLSGHGSQDCLDSVVCIKAAVLAAELNGGAAGVGGMDQVIVSDAQPAAGSLHAETSIDIIIEELPDLLGSELAQKPLANVLLEMVQREVAEVHRDTDGIGRKTIGLDHHIRILVEPGMTVGKANVGAVRSDDGSETTAVDMDQALRDGVRRIGRVDHQLPAIKGVALDQRLVSGNCGHSCWVLVE